MKTVTEIIRLTDRNRWMAGIAAAALVAGVGGVLIGRSMTDQPAADERSRGRRRRGARPRRLRRR